MSNTIPVKKITRYDVVDKDGNFITSVPIAVASENVLVTLTDKEGNTGKPLNSTLLDIYDSAEQLNKDIKQTTQALDRAIHDLQQTDKNLQNSIDNIKVISNSTIDSLF